MFNKFICFLFGHGEVSITYYSTLGNDYTLPYSWKVYTCQRCGVDIRTERTE